MDKNHTPRRSLFAVWRRARFGTVLMLCSVLGCQDEGVPVVPKSDSPVLTTETVPEKSEISDQVVDHEIDTTLQNGISAFRELMLTLASENNSDFRQLESHPDNSVAVAAAWERLRDAEPQRTQIEAARFVGYLEGRCQTRAPQWWADRVSKCQLLQGRIRFAQDSEWAHKLNDRWSVATESGITSDVKHGLIFNEGTFTTVIPHEVGGPINSGADHFAVSADKDHLYSCAFSVRALPYKLFCTEKQSGKLSWQTRVQAISIGGYSGPQPEHDHQVGIVVDADRLFVYGIAINCAYCEGFRRIDGHALFRFNSQFTFLTDEFLDHQSED